MNRSRPSLRLWLTVALIASTILAITSAGARESASERSEIAIAKLPAEARDMLRLIRAGGPFAYERDGVTFGNREHLLPAQRRGYYHEYTVATPGARNRGARRIICGGARQTPDVCYYTDDHYASFRRIRE
ncbi:MAG TPA: ribonuclease [Casimicrobiaceae bacterium]|nr:ribonuclease [Casimicrobiaceae bacterium]